VSEAQFFYLLATAEVGWTPSVLLRMTLVERSQPHVRSFLLNLSQVLVFIPIRRTVLSFIEMKSIDYYYQVK